MSTDVGGVSVSNREFEQRRQDEMSEIKLLDQSYLQAFLEEFDKLIENKMYSQLNADDMKKAGDYTLSPIVVLSKESFDGSSQAKKVDITSLVMEIQLYEDLNEKCMSVN